MDAVPTESGLVHLCGHDGHMAVLIGLAEELGEGALLMVAELSRLRVNFDYAFALHNKPNKELNKILMYKNVYAAYQRFCTGHCYKCAYW